jgi:hypothetical protein
MRSAEGPTHHTATQFDPSKGGHCIIKRELIEDLGLPPLC